MRKQRPRLQYLTVSTIVAILCSVFFLAPASWASGSGQGTDALLGKYGLTDKQFEKKAKQYLGIPYRRGGSSPKGMDCSGFARTLYDQLFQISLPHNSGDQYRYSELRKVPGQTMQPGDLVFFTDKRHKRINHVGVYLSNGRFIHASSSQGITVSRLDESYWQRRFAGSKRHKSLASGREIAQLRVGSKMKIPVSTGGTITGAVQQEFQSLDGHFPAAGLRWADDNPYGLSAADSRYLNAIQVGYHQWLGDSLNLTVQAFQEKYDPAVSWSLLAPDLAPGSFWQPDLTADSAVRRGLTLAGDIRPSSWLSVTPSVTYFDAPEMLGDGWQAPRTVYGINSRLTPAHSRWSLSMLMQSSDQQDFLRLTSFDNMLDSVDLAIKLGYVLSSNLQFSITGKHDTGATGYDGADNLAAGQDPTDNLFFTFDLSY